MNNIELVENIARKLEKFNLSDMIIISELSEDEVISALYELKNEQKLIQQDKTYFYNFKTIKTNDINAKYEIILETEPDYAEYLKLPDYAKKIVNKYIQIYNLTRNLKYKEIKEAIKLANIKTSFCTAKKVKSQYEHFGLKGLFPRYGHYNWSSVPDIIYERFKKYYLNKNKLTVTEAIKYAVDEINKENNSTCDYNFSPKSMSFRLKKDFSLNTINHLRETIEPVLNIKTKREIKFEQKCEILFSDAAKHYFKKLKKEAKLQRLLNETTSYKNHVLPYFENYKICDITLNTLREFKERKYNDGYSIASVSSYLILIKAIVRNIAPELKEFAKRKQSEKKYDFLQPNILSKHTIKKLLFLAKTEYLEAYPLIKLAFSTGATIPELLALNWKDINWQNKTIHINKFLYFDKISKYNNLNSCRDLTIDDEVCQILSENINKDNLKEYVFKFSSEDYSQVYFEQKILKPIARKLKLGKFLQIDFQHNFVYLLMKQNVPITYIAKKCGMNNEKFMKIYGNIIQASEKEFYNPLQGIC